MPFKVVAKPSVVLEDTSFCTALASVWSASDQVGKPTL